MRFEHRSEKLAPIEVFIQRIIKNIGIGFCTICVALLIGIIGYHVFEHLPWLDAFVNAAMILSGMGQVGPLEHDAGKIFAGMYALFCGLAFIMVVGIIFSPIIHRMVHKFHLADSDDK